MCNGTNRDSRSGEGVGTASAGEEESLPEEEEEPGTSGVSPLSSEGKSQRSRLSDVPSPGRSPVQPESPQTEPQEPGQESDREAVASEEPLESHTPSPGVATVTKDGPPPPVSPGLSLDKGCGETCNGTSPPRSPRRHKRRRETDAADGPRAGDARAR